MTPAMIDSLLRMGAAVGVVVLAVILAEAWWYAPRRNRSKR